MLIITFHEQYRRWFQSYLRGGSTRSSTESLLSGREGRMQPMFPSHKCHKTQVNIAEADVGG